MARSTEDGLPRGGLSAWQEINAVVYELIVRRPQRPAMWLVLRCYEPTSPDEPGEIGCSIRRTAS